MAQTDLVIVGAGPAGLTAALTAANLGVEVVVIDEQPETGGQIYRQPPGGYQVSGRAKAGAGQVMRQMAADHPMIRFRLQTIAWGLFAEPGSEWRVGLAGPDGQDWLEARRVLLAPGAHDMPVAFPGWTLPGVMTTGGVQTFLKGQQVVPGQRFLLAGAHPLQLLVAAELVRAGAEVAAVVFAPHLSLGRLLRESFQVWGHWGKLAEALEAWHTLRRAGVPIRFGQVITAVVGNGAVEKAVVAAANDDWAPIAGTEYEVKADTVALGYGFLPSTELARQAGAEMRWRPAEGGWVCTCDDRMESTVAGLYVAGEITGVSGAEVSTEEGRMAGLAIAQDLGLLDVEEAGRRMARVRRALNRHRRFASVLHRLFAPQGGLQQLMTDDTILCRCEGLTVGQVREAIRVHPHVRNLNALKQLTRSGMGLCQGRFCGANTARLLAAEREMAVSEVGLYTARPPVKPIRLSYLATDASGEAVREEDSAVRTQTP